jgi:hypothetical protein
LLSHFRRIELPPPTFPLRRTPEAQMATKPWSLPQHIRLSDATKRNFSKPPSGRLPGRLDEKYTAHVARRHTLDPQARAVTDRLPFCEISRLTVGRLQSST